MIWVTWGYLLAKSTKSWILLPFPIFHQSNKNTNRNEQKPRLFCGSPEKINLKCLNNVVLWFFFFNFSLEVFPNTSMLFTMLFTWFLNSWKACSVSCVFAVGKTKLSRRTSSNASCWSLNARVCRYPRLEYRITSEMVVQTAHVYVADQPNLNYCKIIFLVSKRVQHGQFL